MTNAQLTSYANRTEAFLIVKLKVSSAEELRRFLAGPWTASVLSPEELEELYQELHQQEASARNETAEEVVEVGRD